ncbi:hypothetical protein AOR01nite_06800 [Acetobacter orleanensis]|uniref:Pectate lyase superfamily protein domain-containing protein n=1 Tax=Acetobacter orleanensis TaxID=104099 RepID=A0A4Y3TKB4_9PROT|nr:hypothetical protein Abol_030_036 [Acetobacter orleanensis JCM 7639]GEB82203.1 hypothetical protein AOR01nite_06800 [Acetobacter orleanensis]
MLSLCSGIALLVGVGVAASARPNHMLPEYQSVWQPQHFSKTDPTVSSFSTEALNTPKGIATPPVRLRSLLAVSSLASSSPPYLPTHPPGGLDAATGVPALWQNATIGQIGAMADGSVQQSDKGAPNGVAALDANGAVTAPVSGDLSTATAKIGAQGAVGRPLAARFADLLNAKDFGLALDGKTDDTAALQAAKNAASSGAVIRLPAGKLALTAPPTGNAPNLWQANGTMQADGGPLTSLGTDVLESTLEGGKYFARGQTAADMPPVLRKDLDITHSGGTTGFVMNLEKGNCTIPSVGAALNDYVWCHSTVLNSAAFGSGQHVAQASMAQRPANALADGKGSRSQIWAGYDETRDDTGQPSNIAGSLVGREIDVYANADDPNNWRIGLQLQIAGASSSGTPGRIGKGIALGNNDSTSTYGIMLDAAGRFDTAGIDLSRSTPVNNAPVLNIGANRNLAFSDDHKPHFQFDSAAYTLRYWYDTTPLFSVGMNGDITTAIANPGSGIAWTLGGQALIGLNLANLNTPEAMRLGAGQALSWEPTAVVQTRFTNGQLIDQVAAGVARTLDTQGNETIPGAIHNSQTIVSLTQPTAGAFVAQGTAAIGLDTTGLTAPDALRLAGGQNVSWEQTGTVKTSFANSKLQDAWGGTVLRTLDQGGNETLTGSSLNSGMTTNVNNTSASAVTLTGTAAIGVNLSGLSTPQAFRLGSGQAIAWEPTGVITTGYTANGLRDANGSTALRLLDTAGNENLSGALTPAGGVRLPTFSRVAIKAMSGLPIGTTVYDADDDTPAVYTSAGWKMMALNAIP